MRHAMATCAVGDDVWGEDPTVAALEARAAALTGKEAALFVCTGTQVRVWWAGRQGSPSLHPSHSLSPRPPPATRRFFPASSLLLPPPSHPPLSLSVPASTQGNLTAVLALASPAAGAAGGGAEALVGDQSHIYQYEQGGLAALGGLAFNVIPTQPSGELAVADLAARLRRSAPGDPHAALSAVLCLESTHNRCGGAVLGLDYLDAVAAWAASARIPIHLDGARLFNAAVACGVPVSAIAARVTSLTFCLSKGGGAPAGSVVCGPADVIARARRLRKALGGGLRQAGVLAACGLVALDDSERLAGEDARRARALAAGLAAIPGVLLDTDPPASNIVIFGLAGGGTLSHDALVSALATRHGVRVAPFRGRIRAVTSREVGDEGVAAAVAAVAAVVGGAGGGG